MQKEVLSMDFKFTTNYANNNESNFDEALPAGTYEMVIKSVQEQATPGGAEAIHFDFVVRNDLDQALPNTNGKQHNRHLFFNEWKRKATNQYSLKNLNAYMNAVGIPEGTTINSFNEFCQLMIGKPVRLDVTIQNDTYNGITTKRNAVAPWGWHKSKFPNVQKLMVDPVPNAQPINIPDSDLPF